MQLPKCKYLLACSHHDIYGSGLEVIVRVAVGGGAGMSPALGPYPVVVMWMVLVLAHPTEVVLDHGGHVALNPGHQVLHLCKAAVNEQVNNCLVAVMLWMVNINMSCSPCNCIAVLEGKVQMQ